MAKAAKKVGDYPGSVADPRSSIFASVARRQAGLDPRPGEVFMRDGEPLIVSDRSEGRVSWRTASGEDQGATLAGFRERAADPVDAAGGGGSYLDNVWDLAVSKGIPRDVRALAVQRALRRAPSPEDALTVRRWASTLSSGLEPRRNA